MRYLFLVIAMCLSVVAKAQDEPLTESPDSTNIAVERPDSATVVKPQPVRPVKTLGQVAPIDTLATESAMISIVLFNDNTWRYVMSENYKADSEVFSDGIVRKHNGLSA